MTEALQVRRFGREVAAPPPDPRLKGMHAAVIALPPDFAATLTDEEKLRRYKGMPIVLDRPNLVVSLYFEPHSHMHEHPAAEPILCLAISGRGFVRIGGLDGQTLEVGPGDAVLWPGGQPHKVWTEDNELQIILFHYQVAA